MLSEAHKHIVRHKFNRANKTYDQHCHVQNKIAKQAIALLVQLQQTFSHVADFACGTGESTRLLLDNINYHYCYALDFAEQLLTVAHNKLLNYTNVNLLQQDFDVPKNFDAGLDLIFCNMGLQWSDDINHTLSLWKNHLNPQGLLLFSLPVAGNFPEINNAHKAHFLSGQQISVMLEHNHFEIITHNNKHFIMKFNDQYAAIKSLKATGANYKKPMPKNCKDLRISNLMNINKKNSSLASPKLDDIFIQPDLKQLTYNIEIFLARKI